MFNPGLTSNTYIVKSFCVACALLRREQKGQAVSTVHSSSDVAEDKHSIIKDNTKMINATADKLKVLQLADVNRFDYK